MSYQDSTILSSDAEFTRLSGQMNDEIDSTMLQSTVYQEIDSSLKHSESEETEDDFYQVGDYIGHEQIYEVMEIHRGNMGIVYGVYDHAHMEYRAIKTLQKRLCSDLQLLKLFEEEAVLWVKLAKHPFIASAYCVESSSLPYVVMDFVRGRDGMSNDLRGWLGHPDMTLAIAVEMGLQIAQGMQHTQKMIPGMIHRDLKPANILVDSEGKPHITDFGLVCSTQTGVGTPAYMSPEQWLNEPLSIQTDIYAYGCILYEMLTGHRTFLADKISEWRNAHVSQIPVSIRELIPEVPEGLEQFVFRCMAKEKKYRPAGWDEVVENMAYWFSDITGQLPVMDFKDYKRSVRELRYASESLMILYRFDEALTLINKALEEDPEDVLCLCNKSRLLSYLGRHDEALTVIDQAFKIGKNAYYLWHSKAEILESLQRYDEALKCYNKSIKLESGYMASWHNKGCLLYYHFKDYEGALECFSKSAEMGGDSYSFSAVGATYNRLGRYEEAMEAFQEALKLNPNNEDALSYEGEAYIRLGKYQEALASCEKALSVKNNYPDALYFKAIALNKLGRIKESKTFLKKAKSVEPDIEMDEYKDFMLT